MVVLDFGWTATTPSLLSSATTTSTTNQGAFSYLPLASTNTTSGQSLGIACSSFASVSAGFIQGSIGGIPANFVGVSNTSGLQASDTAGCEFAVIPWALHGYGSILYYGLASTGGAGTTAFLAY